MRLEKIRVTVKIVVPYPDTHPCLFVSIPAEGHAARDSFFAKCAIVIIHKQQTRSRVASYKNIRPPIFVDICCHNRKPIGSLVSRDPGLLTHVGESTVAIVPVKGVVARRQTARATVHWNVFEVAVRLLARLCRMFEVELHVVRHKKIQVPIAVVIQETASCAPSRSSTL